MSQTSLRIALIGNPNCGKTALFNRLTGSQQKVANYAGVTVERKLGQLHSPAGHTIEVLDLPGAYSLSPTSLDESVTHDICYGLYPGEPVPDLLICVVDATNLRLHLRFVLELKSLQIPIVIALNMVDSAQRQGIVIDREQLAHELQLPIVETIAIQKNGAQNLLQWLDTFIAQPYTPAPYPQQSTTQQHSEIHRVLELCVQTPQRTRTLEDTLDHWLLHPVFGFLFLTLLLFLMFQAVYAGAAPLMEGLEIGIQWMSAMVTEHLPSGPLSSLLVDGILTGVGTVLLFLPQILILFLFILVLEESGYLPRAAFLLDTWMHHVGLSGRSFIPLLSSFACAVPGIMATRTIQNRRDRLVTIMIAPLMTCSARLPVYTILIGAFIPARTFWGFIHLQGLVLFALYVTGILSATLVAWIVKRWRPSKEESTLLLELPAYRLPYLRDLAWGLWERASIFIRRVGSTILCITILLWVLLSIPAAPEGATLPAIHYSFAGQIGQALVWVFAPLGFSWEICVALIPGLAAREVAVSSLATVYALSNTNSVLETQSLAALISQQWSLATALSLLVWYIYAPMCLSTLATMQRETNSWKQTGWVTGYLFLLAYLASFATYQLVSWMIPT